MKTIITLDDFPSNEANCGNCTRKGGGCLRSKSDKTIHNGYMYGIGGDPSGIIYRCPHYTGPYAKGGEA